MAEKKYFRQGRTRLVEGEGVDPSIVPQTFEEFQADQARPGARGIEEYFADKLAEAEARVATAVANRADNPSKASQAELTAAKAALETAQNSLTTLTDLTDVPKIEQLKILRENQVAQEEQARYEDKPTEDPGEGNIWSYSVAEGRWKKVKVSEPLTDTQRLMNSLTGNGTEENPYRYKDTGELFNGSIGFGDFVNGVLKSSSSGSTTGTVTGKTYTAPDGRIFTDLNAYNAYIAQTKQTAEKTARQSAYDLLFEQFNQYGLGGLVAPLQGLIESGINPSEFTIKLRETDAYKKRFAANAQRINKGLRALSEAEYIGLEDQYQDVMRRYGLPASYYARGDMGRQEGFEKFIGGDVSPVELEDRVQTAQRRVLNAAPQVRDALTQFYGAEIGNGDILAYVLDPEKAIENIKRKVTAAEIGAGAMQAGLATGVSRAEELQRFGVTGEQARTGYQAIAGYLPRASTLADIYAKQGMGPFTQTTAEAEVFGTPGSVEAAQKRRKITELEQAQFGGTSGVTGGALARERAGQY